MSSRYRLGSDHRPSPKPDVTKDSAAAPPSYTTQGTQTSLADILPSMTATYRQQVHQLQQSFGAAYRDLAPPATVGMMYGLHEEALKKADECWERRERKYAPNTSRSSRSTAVTTKDDAVSGLGSAIRQAARALNGMQHASDLFNSHLAKAEISSEDTLPASRDGLSDQDGLRTRFYKWTKRKTSEMSETIQSGFDSWGKREASAISRFGGAYVPTGLLPLARKTDKTVP